MENRMITKDAITARAVFYQLLGYGILLLLIAGDEIFDLPHLVFGAPATPINWAETAIEGAYIALLCAFSCFLSLRFLKRIKFMAGFLPICSYCKKIRTGEEWTSIEAYMSEHSEALLSHGLCPDCVQKYYGEYAQPAKGASPQGPATPAP